jgi:hypothetical protein
MKCQKHMKEMIGNCTWCGRQMSQKCIKITDGKKMYCETCAGSDVGKMIREKQLRTIKSMDE